MATHPGRLTEIITSMVPAFAGLPRDRAVQIAQAVDLVLETKPTLEELADAREELLVREHYSAQRDFSGWREHWPEEWKDELRAADVERDAPIRAAKAEVLAIVEQRLLG